MLETPGVEELAGRAHFDSAALNGVAVHSNSALPTGSRKHSLEVVLRVRASSPQTLSVVLGDFNVTFQGDHRSDLQRNVNDFADDLIGAWIMRTFGEISAIGYEGYSRCGAAGGVVRSLDAIDHVLVDLPPIARLLPLGAPDGPRGTLRPRPGNLQTST